MSSRPAAVITAQGTRGSFVFFPLLSFCSSPLRASWRMPTNTQASWAKQRLQTWSLPTPEGPAEPTEANATHEVWESCP